MIATARPRNDPAQYDDLVAEWWAPRGRFAMLHWIAAARARRIPQSKRPGGMLLDIACGGGLLAPHLSGHGYRHVGIDLSAASMQQARGHDVTAIRADAGSLPFANAAFDVVVAGEVLEHVADPDAVIGEACRVLRPGGLLVIDTIARTWWGKFSAITIGERMPAGPPKRLHDGRLFIDRNRLRAAATASGVDLELNGLRPSARDYAWWLVGRRDEVRMLTTRSTAGLFQAVGRKSSGGATR